MTRAQTLTLTPTPMTQTQAQAQTETQAQAQMQLYHRQQQRQRVAANVADSVMRYRCPVSCRQQTQSFATCWRAVRT